MRQALFLLVLIVLVLVFVLSAKKEVLGGNEIDRGHGHVRFGKSSEVFFNSEDAPVEINN